MYDENNSTPSDNQDALSADQHSVWHHLSNHKPYEASPAMMVVEGKGLRVKDAKGKEYLDATAGGLWTVNVGYGRERMAKAVYDQLLKLNFLTIYHLTLPVPNPITSRGSV